jgi:peptidoglycan hydrolase-like protein with peptidoglycan-binding domain
MVLRLFSRPEGRAARRNPAEAPPERGRQRTLVWVAVAATAVSLAGIGASTWVKSPQQVAAEAAPPEPSTITAEVDRRVLKQTVVLRGSVAAGKTVNVAAGEAVEGKSVVTRVTVREGQRVRAGAVVSEVSGRPIIALPGKIPAYRDIRTGAHGPDVRQLQQALRALGYGVADPPGRYGSSTRKAVERLFEARGYEPATDSGAAPGTGPATGSEGTPSTGRPRGPAPLDAPRATGRGGAIVRSGEVAFVPKFPAVVAEVKAGLGAEVTGTILTLSSGDLVVRGTLSAADRKLVSRGKRVSILDEEGGREITGRVTTVGSFAKGDAKSDAASGDPASAGEQPGYPIVVRSEHSIPERLAGMEVRLTIETASTGHPVLVVPASAIFANADGSTRVVKVAGGGARQQITVRTGPSSGGFVAVESEGLAEGDLVVVGK